MLEKYRDILTIEEACEILMVGRNRMYDLLRNKEIPSFRTGRTWKIPKLGIEQYIIERSGLQNVNKKE